MAMEQGLYAQVVKLCRKDLNLFATDKNKNETKFRFQGLSAISKQWFDIDSDWIEVNFSTSDPDFYEKLSQSYDNTKDTNTFENFQFPVGNAKCVESFLFQNNAPILKYFQKSLNGCCFNSLALALASINHSKAESDISLRVEYSLESAVGNHIDFIDYKKRQKKGENKVQYSLIKYKQKGP